MHDEATKEVSIKTRALEELTLKFRQANKSAERVQSLQEQVDIMTPQVQRLERLEAELQRLREYVSAAKNDQKDLVATREDLSKAHADYNAQVQAVNDVDDTCEKKGRSRSNFSSSSSLSSSFFLSCNDCS